MQLQTHPAVIRPSAVLLAMLIAGVLLGVEKPTSAAANEPHQASRAGALLARGAGYGEPAGSARVRTLQVRLRMAGETPGPVDGRFGPLTEAAVRHFQAREDLAVDGLVGRHTQAALRRPAALLRPGAGYGSPHGSPRVRTLQRQLRSITYRPGPVDGRFGPLTEAAVLRFQGEQGLPADGVVGELTRAALRLRLAQVSHHSEQRRGASNANTTTGQPRAAGPAGAAPVDNQQEGAQTTARLALALVGALALVSGILAFALGRAVRRPRAAGPVGKSAPAAGGPPTDVGERVPASEDRRSKATTVVGYTSGEQPGDRHSADLRAQAERLTAECEYRGLSLLEIVREREPEHGRAQERPGLGYALQRVSVGDAKGLVVTDLSRLTHSVNDLGRLLEWLRRSKVRLVSAAERLDTEEAAGRLVADALIQVSTRERQRIAERTRKGMEAARRKGPRAVADYPELRERIARMRAAGMTLQEIADQLNAEGVPTVRGGAKWRPSSLQAVIGHPRPSAAEDPGFQGGEGNGANPGGGGQIWT
jgi:peptidoglycan hydrolase-like protein with peptidoglycan-binding domain/DNA invertase Pin-like site-specific DNA recombinase